MLLEAQDGANGLTDRDLCFVADIRIAERIGPAPDHTARMRAIRAACYDEADAGVLDAVDCERANLRRYFHVVDELANVLAPKCGMRHGEMAEGF